MRVALFGLPYSPNVGDGVIADCLRHGIGQVAPGTEIHAIDLSGRSDWGAITVKNRGLALRVLGAMPAALRGKVVETRLNKILNRVEGQWRAALNGADLAIIGGGQLFSDADLNFPVKVARAARLAQEAGVPLAVHAVGVAKNWSGRGTELFAHLLQGDLRRVAVRDATSMGHWSDQMPGGPAPALARDPGLLAAQCYGSAAPGPAIGICITDPTILAYHAESQVAGAQDRSKFWLDMVLTLTGQGHTVRLFCNGALEDAQALARLAAHPDVAERIAAGQVSVAEPPVTSLMLGAEIATHRAVIAHRLHACIVAYAYGRPVVGLGWDRKVQSFFESVDLAQNFVEGKRASGRIVAERLEAALTLGIDADRHAEVLEETRSAIAETLAVIR